MNVLSCSINTLKELYDISGVEVGQHFYWQIGGFQVHDQVLITSWVVIAILLGSVTIAVKIYAGVFLIFAILTVLMRINDRDND